ncbi:hypothetical protein [Cecembia calidifontis]|jgi:hypothetical protein|uniref:Uncharacterized protein n=1 Tax=Cecembia calidifontis TaxID=1187080 RepID=A0A4Q7PAB7_9BACT|nr:hypothetical protein [Cecembia calidifontis]RZS97164.1 hypothetical protein BC751_2762 [Cecembia calidifontis]
MSKKNKKLQPTKFSPKAYLKERGRKLPLYKCWINEEWKEEGMAHIFISRKHSNGNITFGTYLIDLLEKGLKDSFARVNEPEHLLEEIIRDHEFEFIEVDYHLVHNIIYGGLEFADEMRQKRDKEFIWTQYVLEEDTDDIPWIDIPFGYDDEVKEEINLAHQSGQTVLSMVDLVYDLTFGMQPKDPDFYEKRLDAKEEVKYKAFNEDEAEAYMRDMEIFLPYLEEYEKIIHEESFDPAKLDSFQEKVETALLFGKRLPQLYDLLSNIFIQKEDEVNTLRIVQNQLKAYPYHPTSTFFAMLKLIELGKIDEVETLLGAALDVKDLPFAKDGLSVFEVCLFYTVRCKIFMARNDFDKAEVYYDFVRDFQMEDRHLITDLHLNVLMEFGEYKRNLLEEHYQKPFIDILEEEEEVVKYFEKMAKEIGI